MLIFGIIAMLALSLPWIVFHGWPHSIFERLVFIECFLPAVFAAWITILCSGMLKD